MCTPDSTQTCYGGTPGTAGTGKCVVGTQTCAGDGSGWTACSGEITPAAVDDCAAKTDDTCDGFTCGQTMWVKDVPDHSQAKGVGVDANGNVIVAGEFTGSIDFGGSLLNSVGSDLYVAKLDPTGKHLWSKRFGGAGGAQTVDALAVDPVGAVLVAGRLYQGATIDFGGGPITSTSGGDNSFVVKLDAQGNYVWAKLFSGNQAIYVNGLTADPSGNAIAVGQFVGTADFGSGNTASKGYYDMFAVKLASSNGSTSWAKTFGDPNTTGTENQYANYVAADANGTVFVTGFGYYNVQIGNITVVLGTSGSSICIRLDTFGVFAGYALLSASGAPSVAVDGSGNVFLTSYATGTVNFPNGGSVTSSTTPYPYVAKLDPMLNFIWGKVGYGGGAMATDATGNVIVTDQLGYAASHLQKLDPSGNLLWDNTFGTDAIVYGLAAAPSSGRVVMAGKNTGTIDFGTGPITAPNKSDTFVVQFAP